MDFNFKGINSIYHFQARDRQASVAIFNRALETGALPTRKILFTRAAPIVGTLLTDQYHALIRPLHHLLFLVKFSTMSQKKFMDQTDNKVHYAPTAVQLSIDVGFNVLRVVSQTLFNTVKVAFLVLGFVAPRVCVIGWRTTEQLAKKIDDARAYFFKSHATFEKIPFKIKYSAATLLLEKSVATLMFKESLESNRKKHFITRFTRYLDEAMTSGKINVQHVLKQTKPDREPEENTIFDATPETQARCHEFFQRTNALRDRIQSYFDSDEKDQYRQLDKVIDGLISVYHPAYEQNKALYQDLKKLSKQLSKIYGFPKRIPDIAVPFLLPFVKSIS
jgi:hypothetical protein